ncbi:MAG: tetratricopeptide repeat protein [Candidatus Competibacteraceae bacterium]
MKQLLKRLLGLAADNPLISQKAAASVLQPAENQVEAERQVAAGNTLEDAGQLTDAETRYRAALKLCPDLARAHLNLGNIQAARKQLKEAAASYREALRLQPGYGAAHANLGKLYLGQNNYPNAAEHYAAAVQALPESAEVWVGLGSALEELTERRTEAVEAYQRALAIQSGFAGAKLNLGQLLVKLNRHHEAVEYLQDVLSAMPERGLLVHTLLGQAMINMG